MKSNMRHPGEPLLELTTEFMRARRNSRFADTLMEGERLCQRPLMLKGLVAAGRHSAAGGWPGRFVAGKPRIPGPAIDEARDGRKDGLPAPLRSGYDPRAPGSKEPLVTAGHQKVAAKLRQGHILYAKAVDAVHAQEHALGL